MSSQLSPKEHLERSLEYIHAQEAQMRRSLQSPQGRLLVAIKNASQMLGELRTSALPPKPYYELYNACFDAMTLLQGYMREAHRNHHLADVYEIVEYTGNVLPRLYLMITVGTAYLGSGDAPNQDVLKDMLEMSRGVQQPLRGMFLRYYLGQRTRDFLATTSKADLQFSIQFTLTNFVEMNKLWVRYQHQGHSREFNKRLEERRQLQTVVGSNIYRLAQLDTIDLPAFRDLVLPSVLEQVIQCRDPLAQEYLLDVVTQAFPAEYHLDTLEQFFDCIAALVPQTSKRAVLVASLSRMIEHVKTTKEEGEEKRRQLEAMQENVDTQEVKAQDAAASTKSVDEVHTEENKETEEQRSISSTAASDKNSPHEEDSAALSERDDNVGGDAVEDAAEDAQTQRDDNVGEDAVEDAAEDAQTQDSTAVSDKQTDDEKPAPSDKDVGDKDVGDKDAITKHSPDDGSASAPSDLRSESEDAQTELEGHTSDSADKVADSTAELKVSEPKKSESDAEAKTPEPSVQQSSSQALPSTAYISEALELYWHTIQQLELNSADRAVMVQKLVELSELVDGGDLSLFTLLEYVVKSDLKPSPELEQLILTLFDSHHQLGEILSLLKKLPQLLASQSKETRHAVASKVLDNIVTSGALISDVDQANQVFSLFGMLLKTGDLDATKITQLLHLLQSSDGNTTLELLQLAYRSLREGGPTVVKKTFGVLVNTTLMLLHKNIPPVLVGRALKFVNKICHDLTSFGESPLTSYRLYLLAVSAADFVGAEEAAYELFAEALATYEEYISDSRQQVAALAIAIRALQRTTVFSEDNFAPLAQRCQQSCQRLLKKQDQCRMLLLVATLYSDTTPSKVSPTLSKALHIADSILETNVSLELFLDILESNLFFLAEFEKPTVTVDEVNSLLSLIKQNFEAAKADESDETLVKLRNRLQRIHAFVRNQEEDVEEYQELVF